MSAQALQLIAENIRTKNPVLDLGNCGLTELYPELLAELAKTGEWLEELIWSNDWWDWEADERKYSQNQGRTNKLPQLQPTLPPLPKLRILIAVGLGITDCSPLAGLHALNKLYISTNQISDCSPLARLNALNELYIYSNKIADFSPLAGLYALNELDISYNKIADCSPLAGLHALNKLYISGNQIADCSPLAGLHALNTLDISSNKIADCSPLAGLNALNKLDISYNKIADCSPLAGLHALNTLDISDNHIADCSPLAGLNALNKLHISDNHIADCSPLAGLHALNTLVISSNRIADCSPLAGLNALNKLHISYNQIADCSPLAGLYALNTLVISHNKIADCSPLAGLNALNTLIISGNQIADCSPLAGLYALNTLHVSRNKIADCSPLAGLNALNTLYISSNQIKEFPFARMDHWVALENLRLHGNPIQNIDKAVYDRGYYTNVLTAVKDFIKDLRQGSTATYASKLVLVGNGRVGKTCLVKRWLDDTFDAAENSTHAIQLRQHALEKLARAKGLQDLQLNIWDFGGQDIYHATHQIFLNTNALFVLVWDAGTEAQPVQAETLPDGKTIYYPNHRLRYWLSYIKTIGRNSPVLLVQTKAGSNLQGATAPPDITEQDREQFNIRHILAVDSAEKVTNGFANLEEKIEMLVHEQVQQQCTQLPTTWYQVRQQIEQWRDDDVKRITLDAYQQRCANNGLDASSTQTLLQYLHDTGTLFYRKGLFGNQLVIDQQWAIDAVYTLFDRRKDFYKEFRNNGFFTGYDLQIAWQAYNEAEQELFVSFMQSCRVCVELNPSRYDEPKKPFTQRQFLAPQLLPADGERIKHYPFSNDQGPRLVYRASFLHAAVIQQIIVQLAFLSSRYDIWANGIIITTNEGMALIEADEALNELRVQLHITAQLSLLETLQKAIAEVVRYDAAVQTTVSLDGETYIDLQALQQLPPGNTQVQANNGQWVAAADYRVFLPQHREQSAEKARNPLAHLQPAAKPVDDERPAVFFSYAWKDESNEEREAMVDAFYATLSVDMQAQIVTRRDKIDVQYGDLISDYMKRIGRARHIFVFLSDKYLRSPYCMYELHLAYAANCSDTRLLKEVIYPVRVEDINLGETLTRKHYSDFWQTKINELSAFYNDKPKERIPSGIELKKLERIKEDLDELLFFLNDICTPDTVLLAANNYEKVKTEINRRLANG